jgi:hypothetical protein
MRPEAVKKCSAAAEAITKWNIAMYVYGELKAGRPAPDLSVAAPEEQKEEQKISPVKKQ